MEQTRKLVSSFDRKQLLEIADKHGVIEYQWQGQSKFVQIKGDKIEELTKEEVNKTREHGKL